MSRMSVRPVPGGGVSYAYGVDQAGSLNATIVKRMKRALAGFSWLVSTYPTAIHALDEIA